MNPFRTGKGWRKPGIRQIKRALLIDMKSIRFLDDDMKKKILQVEPLKEYIETFETQGKKGNDPFFNHGLLTNLGIFQKICRDLSQSPSSY